MKQLNTGKIEITAHNHNFAVDPDSLAQSEVELTHVDLNDKTLEGLRHRNLPLFSVQYHPEAAPGPHDSHYLFNDFVKMMEEWKRKALASLQNEQVHFREAAVLLMRLASVVECKIVRASAADYGQTGDSTRSSNGRRCDQSSTGAAGLCHRSRRNCLSISVHYRRKGALLTNSWSCEHIHALTPTSWRRQCNSSRADSLIDEARTRVRIWKFGRRASRSSHSRCERLSAAFSYIMRIRCEQVVRDASCMRILRRIRFRTRRNPRG